MNLSKLLLPLASLFAFAAFGCGTDSASEPPCGEGAECADGIARMSTPTEEQTACSTAADCTPVFAGEACSACVCANAAVRADARAEYQASFDEKRSACGDDPGAACVADCAQAAAVCTEGKCELAK